MSGKAQLEAVVRIGVEGGELSEYRRLSGVVNFKSQRQIDKGVAEILEKLLVAHCAGLPEFKQDEDGEIKYKKEDSK